MSHETAQGPMDGLGAPSVGAALSAAGPAVAAILEKALSGGEVTPEEGARLFDASGKDLRPLFAAADQLRAEAVGDIATYVVNRNINFTNVCVRHCGFCAFSRGHVADEGYYLPVEEVVRRAAEAREMGATEVCVQAGLAPGMDPWHYVKMLRAIKTALPDMHVHGFSPEEVLYGATLAKVSVGEYLLALKEAGLGSLPGTAAEVLVQRVRDVISPGRITVEQWVDLIGSAHRMGIPTTSTMMYGHVETALEKAVHLDVLRRLQKETGGITEFVPLGFIYEEAPMSSKRTPPGLRHGPSGVETLKMYAVARIMLHGWISNIQVSWVKEGPKLAQVGLMTGANDLGGTLINESISTSAGAQHGQLQTPAQLRALAREVGRVPAERATTYRHLRVFHDPAQDPRDALDRVEKKDGFGSYQELIRQKDFRFKAQFSPAERKAT
jgi:FO synthase subunit 2